MNDRRYAVFNNCILSVALISCVFYSIFGPYFAKLYILNLQPWNLPIFFGEALLILLILSLAVAGKVKSFKIPLFFRSTIILYILFVLFKASSGYLAYGNLAFRNAALYYYVFFGIIIYFFWSPAYFISLITRVVLLTIVTFILLARVSSIYFVYVYCLFFIALTWNFKGLRLLGLILCAYFIFHNNLFNATRGSLVSILFSFLYLFLTAARYLSIRINNRKVFILSLLAVFVFGSVIFGLALNPKMKKRLKSWSNIHILLQEYKMNKNKALVRPDISAVADKQVRAIARVSLKSKSADLPGNNALAQDEVMLLSGSATVNRSAVERRIHNIATTNSIKKISGPGEGAESLNQVMLFNMVKAGDRPVLDRTEKEDMNNILWRVFIWEDMFGDLLRSGRIFGIDFGKPFKSYIISKLGWHNGDDVGWIEPHNSYLHILYRSGLVGLVIISFIAFLFVMMAAYFSRVFDFIGILLCANLLYWIFLGNFIVLLELPYFAIPFWISFGLAYAYYTQRIKAESPGKSL